MHIVIISIYFTHKIMISKRLNCYFNELRRLNIGVSWKNKCCQTPIKFQYNIKTMSKFFCSSLVESRNDHFDNLCLTKISAINGFFSVHINIHTLYNDHPTEDSIIPLNVTGLSIITRGKFTTKMLKNDIKMSFLSYLCLHWEISRKYGYY